MTPSEVCNHFRAYGIYPFWQPGDSCEDLFNSSIDIKKNDNLISELNSKIYGAELCIICLDKSQDVIFLPCMHYICCFNCNDKLIKCPFCKSVIKQRLPF